MFRINILVVGSAAAKPVCLARRVVTGQLVGRKTNRSYQKTAELMGINGHPTAFWALVGNPPNDCTTLYLKMRDVRS